MWKCSGRPHEENQYSCSEVRAGPAERDTEEPEAVL